MDSSAASPTNNPIFVVGSPRSGTSILTWCLGQHPNMLVIPESAWMGDFAIDLAIRYQIGTERGNTPYISAVCANSFPVRCLFTLSEMSTQWCGPSLTSIVLANVVWSPTSRRLTIIGSVQ